MEPNQALARPRNQRGQSPNELQRVHQLIIRCVAPLPNGSHPSSRLRIVAIAGAIALVAILGVVQSHEFARSGVAGNNEMLSAPVGQTFSISAAEASSPNQRIHLILLGVADVSKSAAFYEALGWKRSKTGHDGFVKFDLGGLALVLVSRSDFARDALSTNDENSGFSGIGLIYLAQSTDEVPRILAKAVLAGGTLVKPATRSPNGVAGFFKDPDGHLFEVDYERAWVFDQDHHLVVDELNQP